MLNLQDDIGKQACSNMVKPRVQPPFKYYDYLDGEILLKKNSGCRNPGGFNGGWDSRGKP